MSTPNPADAQTGQEVVLPERGPPELTEPKFTDAQIEKDCPSRLQQIGREIAERIKKAEKQTKLAADHVIAVDKLLAEAKGLCDGGGFNKFRELFCPQLGKSRAYALLAIGAGKRTLAEHRTAERERKQKSRANQQAALANSGTAPEKSEPQEGPTEAGAAQATSTPIEQTLEPARPRSAVAPGDEAMRAFTARVMELDRTTAKRSPEHFATTAVPVEVLARLGQQLTDIANIKRSEAVKPALIMALPDSGTVSAGQPAVKAEHAALEAASTRRRE